MFLQHEHVTDIRERRIIGHYASKSNLPAAFINAETKRVFDGPAHNIDRNPGGPIGFLTEEPMDHLHVY